MRTSMKGKPADFAKEYIEVNCTEAEKEFLKYVAFLRGESMGAMARQMMFGKGRLWGEGRPESERVQHWIDERRKVAERKQEQETYIKKLRLKEKIQQWGGRKIAERLERRGVSDV